MGTLESLREVIERFWGFRTFRPLQEQAMTAVLAGRDSLVVMPTGGGKSLCYQAPAIVRGGTTVVVSPLIALMKDQVDSLTSCGVAAVRLDSSQTAAERAAGEMDLIQGHVRLLFVSPERLVVASFQRLLNQIRVHTFAIDEAHCISHWGHDFRPEYRQLRQLKSLFPGASVHGYTATATERVRRDIIDQLQLTQPEVLVGNFDRPNLTYRVLSRGDQDQQIREILDRHPKEAGIIYCQRRADVEEVAAFLVSNGYRALPYHAGMEPEDRKKNQDAFRAEQCDIVVATVAFGMGIDRSNIRFVLHAAMPKSVEHYQQETGRAGRDNLEAECVLLHSGRDFMTWKYLVEKSASEAGADRESLASALKQLNDMDRFCRGAVCRHRALVEYFGQRFDATTCGACDLCLEDAEVIPEAILVAQKILSCVARMKERFGIGQTVSVLRGENTDAVKKNGHEQLSTFGLLGEFRKEVVREWIYQLIGQKVLCQEGDEYPILRLNDGSWEVMRGQRPVRLLQPTQRKKVKESKAVNESWEGVDRTLFEDLRVTRARLAEQRGVPPYVVFSDATLREMARIRPSTLDAMYLIYGVGERKLRDFGEAFMTVIRQYCLKNQVAMNQSAKEKEHLPAPARASKSLPPGVMDLFRRQASIETVMVQTQRARSTVVEYLSYFISVERPASIAPWVREQVCQQVAAAARQVGTSRLKPIYIALGEKVPYDDIRVVLAHLGSDSG